MFKSLIAALILIVCLWGLYLAQVSPEAEEFFYSQPDRVWNDYRDDEISMVGDIDPVLCWIWPKLEPIDDETHCASKDELHEILKDNQKFMTVYKHLLTTPEENPLTKFKSQSQINGNRLLSAQLHLMSIEGSPDKALALWMTNYRYWKRRFINKPADLLGRAIFIVILGESLNSLSHILNTNFDFTASEYQQLHEILEPIHLQEPQIEETLKLEFSNMQEFEPLLNKNSNSFLSFFSGALVDNFYEEVQDILLKSKLPPKQLCVANKRERRNRPEMTFIESFLKFGPLTRTHSFYTAFPFHFILSEYQHNTRRKLLILTVKLKENRVSSSQILNFIEQNPDIARNPLNGELAIFNQSEKKLIFEIKQSDCFVSEYLYLNR